MKKALTIALTVVFVLSLAAPTFAMTHDAIYEWDGTADMERQVGHWCNTGAEQKVKIAGDGQMSRISDITMSAGKLTVEKDSSEFVTAEDATDNLTVTSVIELCAPPKAEYTTTHYVPGEATAYVNNPEEFEEALEDETITNIILEDDPLEIYGDGGSYSGQGVDEQTVEGNIEVSGDNNTLKDFTLVGDIYQTGNDNNWNNVNVESSSPGGNITVTGDDNEFINVDSDGNVTVDGDVTVTFTDVHIKGDLTVKDGAIVTVDGDSTISGDVDAENGTQVELGDNVEVEGEEKGEGDFTEQRDVDDEDGLKTALDDEKVSTIILAEGKTFTDDFTVQYSQTLVAEEEHEATVEGQITVDADDVTIDGLDIQMGNTYIHLLDHSGVEIRNNKITDTGGSKMALRVSGSDNLTIAQNRFYETNSNAITLYGDNYGLEIVDNKFTEMGNSAIHSNADQIEDFSYADNEIDKTVSHGINTLADEMKNGSITGNVMSRIGEHGDREERAGIQLRPMESVSVQGNSVSDSQVGLKFHNTIEKTLENVDINTNTFSINDIQVLDDSEKQDLGDILENNNFEPDAKDEGDEIIDK